MFTSHDEKRGQSPEYEGPPCALYVQRAHAAHSKSKVVLLVPTDLEERAWNLGHSSFAEGVRHPMPPAILMYGDAEEIQQEKGKGAKGAAGV